MSDTQLLAFLMDQAFEADEFTSLLGNLRTVDASVWHARLPESVRTIAEIVRHVGSAKIMYTDYAFGTGALRWEDPEVEPWPVDASSKDLVMPWLEQAHARLMGHVRSLTDADLRQPRHAHWGELKETRWLLSAVQQHDVYHAGEINRMRGLLSGEDRWQWQIDAGVEPDRG